MPADSLRSNQESLNAWASRLACPACLGALRSEADSLFCTACARRYPVIDGIPVLIADRATAPGSS